MHDQGIRADRTALQILDELYLHEVAGIVRYLHYSFMIMGHARIPIQKWLREQASESMQHSILVGEKITSLGGHPSLVSATVEKSHGHTLDGILAEALEFEEQAVALYRKLAEAAAATNDIALEELARQQICSEQEHVDEVRKMLRLPS
jgi:bacterioferritin